MNHPCQRRWRIARFAALSTSLLILSDGAAASAAAGVATSAMPVNIGDLDLDSSAGRRSLTMRLGKAAKTVCGADNSRSLLRPQAQRRCVRDALARALNQIDEMVESKESNLSGSTHRASIS